jgi:hypothetical protein
MTSRPSNEAKSLELFGGYYAEPTDYGTFFVREKGILKSPYEYSAVDVLTPRTYLLYRAREPKLDILFADLSWFLGAVEAYEVARFGGRNGPSIIAAINEEGTHFFSDDGRDLASFRGYPHISIFDGRFFVVYDPEPPGPYVKVYNFLGELVSEGLLWEAQEKALKWRPKPK